VEQPLVRNPEEKKTTWETWHRCEDNINMDLKEIGNKIIYWIQLGQD
jgi:hypothetical protein